MPHNEMLLKLSFELLVIQGSLYDIIYVPYNSSILAQYKSLTLEAHLT